MKQLMFIFYNGAKSTKYNSQHFLNFIKIYCIIFSKKLTNTNQYIDENILLVDYNELHQ